MFIQKGVSAYMDRKPHKFPKRSPARAGLRARTHFDTNQRRLFDATAKQYYWDLLGDTIDGNDKPNFKGILTGTDIPAADGFFDMAYEIYMKKITEGVDDTANLLQSDDDN